MSAPVYVDPPHTKIYDSGDRSLWVQLYDAQSLYHKVGSARPRGTLAKVTLIDKGDWRYQHRLDIPYDAIDAVIATLQAIKESLDV